MTESTSIDSLLDCTLDDLADLPEFKNFQEGAHRVTASWGTKDLNGKGYVTLDFKLLETLELADANAEQEGKEGDECGTIFDLTNEFGQGKLKKAAAPFLESLGMTKIRELVEGAQDIECVVLTGLRTDKKDASKIYLQLNDIQIA